MQRSRVYMEFARELIQRQQLRIVYMPDREPQLMENACRSRP